MMRIFSGEGSSSTLQGFRVHVEALWGIFCVLFAARFSFSAHDRIRRATHLLIPFLVLLVLSLLAPQTHAQATNLWTNPITGTDPGKTNPYTNGQTVATNITVSGIGHGSGVNGANANDRFNATGWNSVSFDSNDYFTFTFTNATGYAIDFSTFGFTLQHSGTGPTNFSIRTSVDSFATDIWTSSFATNVSTQTYTVDISAYHNVTDPITFNIYGWGASSASGTLSVNEFGFKGEVIGGIHWTANGATLGGSGTWNTSNSNWTENPSPVTPTTWNPSRTAVFTNNAGTVTVGSVTASNGLHFATTGYTLTGGTITLDGTNISDNMIITDPGVAATINSKLTGTTGLTKLGTGTVTLGGANDYTGGTRIKEGRVIGTTTSIQGPITNSAALTFDQSTNGTYSGAISGIGSVTKAGAGTVTFSGTNTYTGGTFINAGRLTGTTDSLQGNISVATNATVAFDLTGDSGTYAGNVSGAGSLIKSGASTLTLSGTNTHTGGTVIEGGRITTTVDNLQGNISVATNAAINFNQNAANGTYSGNIIGNGRLVKNGSATLTLTGTNDLIGVQVNAGTGGTGTLIGNTASLNAHAITNNGTLAFNQNVSGNFEGRLAGSGTLIKSGSGTVFFTGSLTNSFTGNTLVEAGTLVLKKNNANNAAISGASVTIGTGAALVLDAVGQIQNTTAMVLDGGTFRTGFTTGHSETLGTLTLSASSTLDLGTGVHELHFADSSSLSWDGTLTINGWTSKPKESGTQGRIYFAGVGLTAAQLEKIQFTGYLPGAMLLDTGEVVPLTMIPEANPLWAAPILLALTLLHQAKRRARRKVEK